MRLSRLFDSAIAPQNIQMLAAMASKTPPGDFAEVGVWRGGSARALYAIAVAQGRTLHLFDTFAGIPCKSEFDMHNVGDFGDAVDVDELQAALPKAKIYVGMFPGTLPAAGLGKLAFVHEDSDQYESTKSVINSLWPSVIEGGVMYFDDFYTADCPGSRKAIEESGVKLQHTPYGKVYTVKEALGAPASPR